MNLLCLDTSSRDASIAVLRDEEILRECNFACGSDLAATLVPSLDFLLRSLGLSVAAIDLFGVAIGPGLFTGIRVGLATLKGLDFTAGRPVAAVSTLEALALKAADAAPLAVPMIDARRGEVYIAGYSLDQGELRQRLAPRLLRVEDAVPHLEPLGDMAFVGSGAENHAEQIQRLFPRGRLLRRSGFLASEVGCMALRLWRAGLCLNDLQEIRPAYIRQPDAETQSTRPRRSGD
ncbi:MAG: tRNA (adenosine(37)-N6)-threonylcarbamoyltransferase complex dimerization subunit type 1 TsaB [Acidobacteria bacterium]|jgi:tRNA threonylcarbamoyladenosine biosynthesis protein TsaB|nr:tRNA (adenosine(37)-N6)-threonylcarbamoyltransferase complex dimerization subunit type 1 TsaB [Acidobacteriota bacterium]